MSTQSVPHLKGAAVPDPKKAADSTTDPKPVGSAAKNTGSATPPVNDSTSLPLSGAPQTAAESSDPAVHQLLAEKQALQMNRDLIDPPVDKDALKAVDERIAEVDKKLADLGFKQETQAQRKAAAEKTAAGLNADQ
jgi:hypothetical protein